MDQKTDAEFSLKQDGGKKSCEKHKALKLTNLQSVTKSLAYRKNIAITNVLIVQKIWKLSILFSFY